jgi:hypothetical protein
MKRRKTQTEKFSGRFGSALAFMVLLFANFPIQAQYESFFGQESWEYATDYIMTCYTDEYDPYAIGSCNATFTFSFNERDTVRIGDYTYYYHQDYFSIFLREDLVNGRLYARYGTDTTDDEYLLCDLSLSVGDTFMLPDGSAHWSLHGDRKMVVDSVHYPSGRKVVYLSFCDEYGEIEAFYTSHSASYMVDYNISLRFMEGVGPIFGIHPPVSEPVLGVLLCLHKDDNHYYMTHEALGCYQSAAGVPLYPESCMQVYPNPTNDHVTLEFTTEMEVSGTAIVRDVVGRVCRQFSVNDKKTVLDVSALPQGVYMFTFIDQHNRKITKKIVKQ